MTHTLHVSTWHPYINGVAGKFVVEQCAALQAAGLQIGLIFSRIEGLRAFSAERALRGLPGFVALENPIPTLGFKSWNVPGGSMFARDFNRYMLARLYQSYTQRYGKPDVLHAHVAPETGLAVREMARKARLDYIVTEHSSEVLNGISDPKGREIAKTVYSDARSVLAVSQPLAAQIRALAPAAAVKVVGNVVRDKVFKLRRADRQERTSIHVMSISSLITTKRIQNAVDATAGLPQAMRDRIVYHVVGDGPDMAALAHRVKRTGINAIFHGNLPHDRTMQMLADMDFLLHPSSFETFGVVLAEAMAVGLPVVATRCGGPETLVNDENGLLVEVDDVPGLTAAMQQLISDLPMWRERSVAISDYARSRFHEFAITKLIEREYL